MTAALPFDEAVKTAIAAALAADGSLRVVTEDARAPWPADRTVVVPVSDRAALGLALGLALGGVPVIAELSGTARLPAVLEVLAEAGAVAAAGELAVPLLVRVPWGAEAAGLDQPVGRWVLDVAGLSVVAASSGAHAAALIRAWAARPGPTVLLEPRALARDRRSTHEGASASVLRSGAHALLVAAGAHVGTALQAADALAAEGIEVAVLDLVRLAPFPADVLGPAARAAGRVVFVGDDDALARRVREAAVDGAFEFLEAPSASASSLAPTVAAVRAALAW
jgi:pyruvate/2-oxoglutarate/acetoin dehydrogenase E1 component